MMRGEAMGAEAMTARAMKAEAARCNADRTLHSDDQREPTHNADHRGELSAKPAGQMEVPTLVNEGGGADQSSETDQKHTGPGHRQKDLEVRHQCVLRTMRLERLMPLLVQSGSLRIDPPCT